MSKKRYCPKCFAAVEVGEDGFLVRHDRKISSGEWRKCGGQKRRGTEKRPPAIRVVSGGQPRQ